MKKLWGLALCFFFIFAPLQSAHAEPVRVYITDVVHQNLKGEFRNDDLAQELTPSGKLGQLVFTPIKSSKIWVIDPALIDEIISMSGDYKLANSAVPSGKDISASWLKQLIKVSAHNDVIALAYGNPDVDMAKRLAPSELKLYYSYGKAALEMALGRNVRSEPNARWSIGTSKLSSVLQRDYGQDRKDLTRLLKVVNSPDLFKLRMRLAGLLSPQLDSEGRAYFSITARSAATAQVHNLRVNAGKYQLTTEKANLPVTVINDFPVEVTINIQMLATNTRIVVEDFKEIKLAANSKAQLVLKAQVIAPGQTTIYAQITNAAGDVVVPATTLALNATVIDSRVTWFTTGAAILLLLAAITQSVRRVRRGRQNEVR